METQRSTENSITQDNITETIDIEAKVALPSKSLQRTRSTGKINPLANSHAHSSNALKVKKSAQRPCKNLHKDYMRTDQTHSSIDDVNNSCSNITASTYINGNDVSTGSAADYERGGLIDSKPNCDRESVFSGISNDQVSHRSHDALSEGGGHAFDAMRRESSSTYERDMDIIDLLERERSIDLGEINERRKTDQLVHHKKLPTIGRTNLERRKLPDITKITAPLSPKRLITVGDQQQPQQQSTNFPNFVFTHQYNEFAEAQNNRNRDMNSVTAVLSARSRNGSQTSFGKRNSDAYLWTDDDSLLGNVNRVSRTRSIDSRKNSTKSNHASASGSITTNYGNATSYPNNL